MKFNQQYLRGNFGIEKESLRITTDGAIALTKHPFKQKFRNPHLTVDFAEQQVEVISGVHPTIKKALSEIELLTNIVYRHLPENEFLWNYSMPFKGQKNAFIALGNGKDVAYRKSLLRHSTKAKQLISGVHFNYSLPEDLANQMSDAAINQFYFKILSNYRQVAFVIMQMFGMSPTKDFKNFNQISYRQSQEFGYNNHALKASAYTSYGAYYQAIETLIKDGEISAWREVYDVVRTKPFKAKRIEWLEIRNLDLDYTQDYSLDLKKLEFLHQFLIFLAFNQLPTIREPRKQTDFTKSLIVLKQMKKWMEQNQLKTSFIQKYIQKFEKETYDASAKPNYHTIIKRQIQIKAEAQKIPLAPISKMELSSQILIETAYLEGFKVKILSQDQNIIAINDIKLTKATLNPFDAPSGLEIISNKVKTNEFLKQNHFATTDQVVFTDQTAACKAYSNFKGQKIVIKPVNTNFSDGLTVFEKAFNQQDFNSAVDFAFQHDKEIIIEKFVRGKEYRFLVINDKLIGILLRIPANVKGDGVHTIAELVKIKNKHKLRGTGYHLPLEKIKLGIIEKQFLAQQNLKINDVVPLNKKVFLRHNSNVSTGGDTIDVTDEVASQYKEIAVLATKKLGLKVCGLDIIIPKIQIFDKYTILEMNWNPAIHIHTYPLQGKNRQPAKALLNLIKSTKKRDLIKSR